MTPDLVAGPATSTRAGADLVERLSGVPAADLLDPEQRPPVWERLGAALAEEGPSGPAGATRTWGRLPAPPRTHEPPPWSAWSGPRRETVATKSKNRTRRTS